VHGILKITVRNRGFYLDVRIGCKIRETRDTRGTMCFHRSASVPARTRRYERVSLRVPKLRRRQMSGGVNTISSRVYLSGQSEFYKNVRNVYIRINVIKK